MTRKSFNFRFFRFSFIRIVISKTHTVTFMTIINLHSQLVFVTSYGHVSVNLEKVIMENDKMESQI